MFTTLLLTLLSVSAVSGCLPSPGGPNCTSPSGNFNVSAFQLYPENADFDPNRCVTYFSVLYNATVAVYDVAKNKVVDTISIPELTGNQALHASGVQMDGRDQLSIVINAGAAFNTEGKDISGDNFLIKYDLAKKTVAFKFNLTAVTNGAYGGYQDVEHDKDGNSFVLGTYPSSIIRVSAEGENAVAWYKAPSPNQTAHGYTGLVMHGNKLIVSDGQDGQLYSFDSQARTGEPVRIPLEAAAGNETVGQNLDGLYMPSLHKGNVILASDNIAGTVVLRSKNWTSVEKLGTIPNPLVDQNGSTVASVQIAQRIYSVTQYFQDAANPVPGTFAGNRTDFPLYDITEQVQKLLDRTAGRGTRREL
ncbi:Uncharacterized protein TPAR_07303 [Tolypocladium paradoxum]|uniref:TRI14-like protein n=1 Tax=Tolypocladium paradoxum TaxID=94208 RepID=A0A2S4KQN8_9HYPO|nr:Uncharacterized protein TPAR_07303 [Tolypocladium paradoxum]